MTGKELRRMRKRLEMTQAELAQALGLQRNSITLMEAGERPVVKATELAVRFLLVKFKKGEGR
jgi:DNA-binding XRE family transcriptional regulator